MPNMFYQQDPGLARKRRLAESMMNRGAQFRPTYHHMQGLGQLAQAISGKYQMDTANQQGRERETRYGETMAEAAGAKPWTEPDTGRTVPALEEMVRALSGNPDTAPIAFQMRLDEAAKQPAERKILKDAAGFQRYETGERLFPEVEAAPKGQAPSSIQEYEYYKNLSPDDRKLYERAKRAENYLNLGNKYLQPSTGEAFEKGISPEQEPEFKSKQITATESAKQLEAARGKWRASESKLLTGIKAFKDRHKVIEASVAKAKALLSEWTTAYGGILANVPATEAKRLSNLYDTIKGNIGISELQAMRASSVTGGALGQVSEFENRFLQASLGSLDQLGDAGDQAEVLDTVLAQRLATIKRMEEAYNMDKAKYGTSDVRQKEAPKSAEPARPTTDAEYNALPSGAMFIDPDDGGLYEKP